MRTHIQEYDKVVEELAAELRKEKKNAQELEDLVCALNQNRASLIEELARVRAEVDTQHLELQQFSAAKRQLSQAQHTDIEALKASLTNANQG